MTKTRALGTRGDELHARMRADILAGRLAPGQRLKSAELCATYDTSVGSAREALTRLQAEGLVCGVPHVGYTVTPLSAENLSELTQARVEIESLVLGLSIEAGDVAWEGQAVAAFHILEHTPFIDETDPGRPSDDWDRAHTNFHYALLAGCPNSRLTKLARNLREEAGLYQLWSFPFRAEPDRDGLRAHRAILEATVGRDVETAKALLAGHLMHTSRLLLENAAPTA